MKINWPNTITIFRVTLAFVTFTILFNSSNSNLLIYLCFALTLIVIAGDYLDGYLARSLKQSSVFGAWLDIAADRLVEICYWVTFSYLQWVSPWVAIIFVTRGVLVDGIRSFAQSQGYTAFGEKTMMDSGVGKFLVASPASRVLYAAIKAIAFGLVILSQAHSQILLPALASVYLATIFCLVRGIPVLIEGKRFLQQQE